MYSLSFIVAVLCTTSCLVGTSPVSATSIPARSSSGHSSNRAVHQYNRAHALNDGYQFDSRDGWQNVNVTDLNYKYTARNTPKMPLSPSFDLSHPPVRRQDESTKRASVSAKISVLGASVSHLVNDVWNSLKGVGTSEPVTITWYTGHDLLNPSCWPQSKWAPTAKDNSFACALTLEGWTTRPKCFKFLEVCNTPKKCVFVRVVDTCAGCAVGSKHVDLTKAAFSALADINEGVLTVQMRPATDPKDWYEDLWGPQTN